MNFCLYYQATVKRSEQWFFVAIIRSFEHMCFDRTLDKNLGIFEFYVPQIMEEHFIRLMTYFEQEGIVSMLQKLPNRLMETEAVL